MKHKIKKNELEFIVKKSLSIAQVCRELGIRPSGGNYKTMNKYFRNYNIDISHFTGKAWNVGKRYKNFGKKLDLEKILVKESTYTSTSSLRKRLYNEGIKNEKCEECGITEWNYKRIGFELDHINGDNLDNRIENLKILCPNCHSQTKTFRGRGQKKKKSSINELRKKNYDNRDNNIIIPKKIKKLYIIKTCNRENCNNEIKNKENKYCSQSCYRQDFMKHESNMPTAGELINKFNELKSYLQVGKFYEVSDNAVRKWCKKYEINDIINNKL